MSRSRYSEGRVTPSSRSIAARSSGMRPISSRSAAVGGTTPSSRPSTSGVPSGAAIEASRPTSRQAGFGTLKFPECTSRRAVSSVSSSERMPRAPKATVGRPLASFGPSITSATSAARRSRCRSVKEPKWVLPISSSPSKMNLSATRGAMPWARMSSRAVEMRPDRALVVGGAAGVQAVLGSRSSATSAKPRIGRALLRRPSAQHRLEGRGLEPPGRGGRLDVVVAVDQHRSAGSREGKRAVNGRIPACFHDTSIEAPRVSWPAPATHRRRGRPPGSGSPCRVAGTRPAPP